MEGVEIREARKDDCKAIRSLIQELADFEKMSDGPNLDDKVYYYEHYERSMFAALEEDGFNSEHPFFSCYVAVADEKIIGYALYYYTYSTWTGKAMYLEDLYVTPEFRKKHVGSMLFKTVSKKAADSGCSRMDFIVLNWNPAQEFYKSKGAIDLTKQEGWHHYRLEKKALKDLAASL